MANKDDYLTYYREFFENFAQTVNPNDQLPVKLGSYKLINSEVIGGVIDWTTQYLTQKKCPQNLIAPLIQIVIDETRKSCKKQPTACGFNPSDNAYEPLKLMQTVMAKTNEICLRYLDNSMLCSLPSPGQPHNVVSVCAAKNKRRRMEDRHVVVHDLNTMFNIQEASPSSYYAIFDGHAGHDAAAYSAAHLHQFLAESKHFATNPEQALLDAFCKTDSLFIDKCNVERFNSGTTAVCALLRPKEKTLYIAWVGDSQALLVNQGRVLQCVNPHKPCRTDERERIEKEGGYVCYWGTWRVNGQLAVSRAIGDAEYKPYVIAVPDIREIPLDGGEDFLILACDGLWDFLSEDDAARTVYNMVCQCPDKTDLISEHLVYLSKERGSADNISVIVVFLREPSKIAAEAHWANRNASPIMDTSLDNANNPFANSNGADNNIIQKSDGLLLNLSENFKHNGADLSPAGDFYHNTEKANGKRLASEFDDDEDLGPETDVDAIDDVLSPSIVTAKALAEGIVNNNPDGSFNPFVEKHEVEKAALEIDLDLQKQQSSEFDGQRSPREETPTPPADAVHDGGLEENLGDSGEESEDEWNYIKGEEANKENISPSQPDCEVADLLEDSDNMSQLNPNAAEFVPVSPTRTIPSPACLLPILDDSVIAQSPKRPSDIDISVPNPQEFHKEVKSRPSGFDSSFSNGHDHDGEQKSPSQELMENLLNGKNLDEIAEFQPGNTPTKVPSTDEFHFGPNAAPFTPAKLLDESEAGLSTKAVFGDESAGNLDCTFDVSKDNVDFVAKKEEDPMSMSFYQDKSEGDVDLIETLNTVQILPENLEEFLAKPDGRNDAISDLTEHKPAKDLIGDEVVLDNDERIQTTDLDNEKELASPVSNDDDLLSGICEMPRSPNPEIGDNVFVPDVCQRPESKSPQPEVSEDVCSLSETKSPEPAEQLKVESPEPPAESPASELLASSPEPEIKVSSPEPFGDTCEISKSPALEVVPPEPDVCSLPKSPELEVCSLPKSPELEVCSLPKSPEAEVCSLPKSPELEVCSLPKSPELEVCSLPKSSEPEKIITPEPEDDRKEILIDSPVEDVTSSVKDVASPIVSPIPDQIISDIPLNFAQEINNAVQATVAVVEASSPIREENLPDVVVEEATPKSVTDTESVNVGDMNSFLERSQVVEMTSPLSPGEQPMFLEDGTMNMDHPLSRCVYPLPTEIKTETIAPEFAEPAVITPKEETPAASTPKEEAPAPQETVKEPVTESKAAVEEVAVAAGAAAVAAVATAAAVAEKKTPKAKTPATTKKPAPKPTTASPTKARAPLAARPKSTGLSKPPATKTATPAAPKPTPKPTPRPKTTTTTSTAPAAKPKPLTNGDLKIPLKTTVAAKNPKLTSLKSPATTKPSPTKTTAPRPTTAPAKTATKTTTTAAPRPGLYTSTKATTGTSSTATKTATSTLKTTASPKAPAARPARPATAPAKPKVPITRTVNKTSADTEKQIKDSANKLTASRTVASSRTSTAATASRTVTSTVRKSETKASGTTRTSLTKTTTTTRTGTVGKKPQEITRTANKTKTTKIEKPVQNGVSTVVTEQINLVNTENDSQLVKDNSPIDNKLLVETNAAD